MVWRAFPDVRITRKLGVLHYLFLLAQKNLWQIYNWDEFKNSASIATSLSYLSVVMPNHSGMAYESGASHQLTRFFWRLYHFRLGSWLDDNFWLRVGWVNDHIRLLTYPPPRTDWDILLLLHSSLPRFSSFGWSRCCNWYSHPTMWRYLCTGIFSKICREKCWKIMSSLIRWVQMYFIERALFTGIVQPKVFN